MLLLDTHIFHVYTLKYLLVKPNVFSKTWHKRTKNYIFIICMYIYDNDTEGHGDSSNKERSNR